MIVFLLDVFIMNIVESFIQEFYYLVTVFIGVGGVLQEYSRSRLFGDWNYYLLKSYIQIQGVVGEYERQVVKRGQG